MTDKHWNEEAMERSITRALEERREVTVPVDFAARVRAGLPATRRLRRRVSVGRMVAIVMAMATMGAMFGLASHASAGMSMGFANLTFDMECVLMLQLAGIMSWLGVRRES